MKELKESFKGKGEVKGFFFTQIVKKDYGYIYRVTTDVDTNRFMHYEVFKRVENKRFECVSYPKSKSFGKWAWTCSNMERAMVRLEEIKIAKELLDGRG